MKPIAHTPLSFGLRPAAPPDDGFLLQLYGETRADELARTDWNPIQREAFLRQQFQARRTDYRSRFPGAEASIVMIGAEDVGVWVVWRGQSEIRLVNIELAARCRRRGVGSQLIRGLLAEGANGRRPVVLSVSEENHGAQRLYRRLGFATEGRANGYLAMRAPPITK